MSGLSPWSLYDDAFPSVKNPNGEGYLCRYCGRPVPKGSRKTVYCKDECSTFVLRALSWPMTRRRAWYNDSKRCVECGAQLKLTVDEGEGDLVAEIHHIVPTSTLNQLATELADEAYSYADEKIQWRRVFARAYIILYNDINNLATLCPSPCHEKWEKMRRAEDKLINVRKLDEFFGGPINEQG